LLKVANICNIFIKCKIAVDVDVGGKVMLNWILDRVAQDKDWWSVVNAVVNLQIP
jgi:hypothetical protein